MVKVTLAVWLEMGLCPFVSSFVYFMVCAHMRVQWDTEVKLFFGIPGVHSGVESACGS